MLKITAVVALIATAIVTVDAHWPHEYTKLPPERLVALMASA